MATAVLRARGAVGFCRPLLVTGAARSGTTWLGEMIADACRTPSLFEPDHTRHAIPYADRPRLGLDEATAALYGRVLRGRVVPVGSVRAAHRSLRSTGLVIKSIHAVPHLPQLMDVTAGLRAVLVVRHPCAVVASRLRHPGFAAKQPGAVVTPMLLAAVPELAEARDRARTPAERHALRWAVDHLGVARAASPAWHTVSYEELIDDTASALGRVLRALGESGGGESRHERPSTTTWAQGDVGDIGEWRDQLGADQVRDILEVARAVGIDWYSEELHPVAPIPGGRSR